MPFDLSIVGKTSEPAVFNYTWKDVVLYSLGIGAKADELDYLYEGKGPKVYPSFAVIPSFPPMLDLLIKSGGNLAAVVHGAQKVAVHAPIPSEGSLRTTAVVRGIYDMKKFASVILDTSTVDKNGNKLFDTVWSIIFRGHGGFDGQPPPKEETTPLPTGREPDFSIT